MLRSAVGKAACLPNARSIISREDSFRRIVAGRSTRAGRWDDSGVRADSHPDFPGFRSPELIKSATGISDETATTAKKMPAESGHFSHRSLLTIAAIVMPTVMAMMSAEAAMAIATVAATVAMAEGTPMHQFSAPRLGESRQTCGVRSDRSRISGARYCEHTNGNDRRGAEQIFHNVSLVFHRPRTRPAAAITLCKVSRSVLGLSLCRERDDQPYNKTRCCRKW
jgi:hypothetical protein